MKENEFGVILEDINGKMDRMAEVISTLATKEQVQRISDRLDDTIDQLKVIKLVVKNHSGQLEGHEQRINVLESA